KSTLLHILGTLDKADAGDVQMNGVVIGHLSDKTVLPVSWTKRLLNLALDSIFIGFLSNYVMILLGIRQSFFDTLTFVSWSPFFVTSATTVVYYTISESMTGRSPAKYIT